MKRNIAIALLGLAGLVAASGAFAQDVGAQANVPFAFSVNNSTLPPGRYRITNNSHSSLLIRRIDQPRIEILTITSTTGDEAREGSCKLAFHYYSGRYFLRQVLCPSRALTATLPVTSQEKRARILEARGPASQSALIAMR